MKISLSMIVKNEEKYLEGCLSSVSKIVDEIILVDTGSTDKTLEIAKKFNAKIFHSEWIKDFSAARNFALSKVTGDWVLYLDADERLAQESISEINLLKNEDRKLGVFCNVISEFSSNSSQDIMRYLRVFRFSNNIKFEGAVHEQIEKSLLDNDYTLVDSNINIIHLGYNANEDIIKTKALRNLEILQQEFENNRSGYNAFQIAQTLMILNQKDKAVPFLLEAVKDTTLENYHQAHAYRLLAAFFSEKQQIDEAEAFINKAIGIADDIPLVNLVAANIAFQKNKIKRTEYFIKKAYESNLNKEEKNIKKFDIYLSPIDIIMRGVQLAVEMQNLSLYKYLRCESKKYQLAEALKSYLILFDFLLLSSEIKNSFVLDNNFSKYFRFESLVNSINSITENEKKIDTLNILKETFKEDFLFNWMFGQVLTQTNNLQEGLDFLETSLKINSKNPHLILELISLYISNNKIEKLLWLLDKSEKALIDFPEVLNKIRSIKEKITNS